ncbi:methionine biosynthesis protein MetW [Halopseudomonas nanhaiensis]|uniref:methionine biosynthesis protein MetW n=1 Tax=Halopseudomonas nanhaiensis TaxID=2830842 RepID=UPI001CBCB6B5|nr:methionine biosynthesis protein MetW [Halopseudomonas nanhaiensis]UAX00118.1 methionine biosynthesis protein MetW [Halopseudomonas nanhaiensis]
MRADLQIIQQWIKPGSRVLDLGCGVGELLRFLRDHRSVQGYGLEIDPDKINRCIEAGLSVIEQNLDHSLDNFADGSFDTVVMTQSLQALHYPDRVIEDMLRIGHEAIITFPNFAHWRCRFYLGTKGRMPVSEFMPYTWYNTPNIHFCTFQDFEDLCRSRNIQILDRLVVDQTHRSSRITTLWPNLLGEVAIYRVTR